MIPQSVKEYSSALKIHIFNGSPSTLIREVDGVNKFAKVAQVGLKTVQYCVDEAIFEMSPQACSCVEWSEKAVGAARDYMSVYNGVNKSSSSSEKTQKAWKVFKEGGEDQIECWIAVAAGVGSVAFIGMFVGAKPFIIVRDHMGINVFGMADKMDITYKLLGGISSSAVSVEKVLVIYQLYRNSNLPTEEYYQKLVPHSVKFASKFSTFGRTIMKFGSWGSPGLDLSLRTISALTGLLSALIKSGQDKKE